MSKRLRIMKRKAVIVSFLVVLFLISAYPVGTLNGAVDDNYGSGLGSQSSNFFDFKDEIFGDLSSLTLSVVSVNNNTGEVTFTGGDAQGPTISFTWDWGDGNISEGWFPQTHTYIDRTRNYILNVTSHYSEGGTGSAQVLVRFVRPSVALTSLSPDVTVTIPNNPMNLINRISGMGIPSGLTYFDDSYFDLVNRSVIEYILTAAASIQSEFANDNVCLIDGGFNQVLLRDPSFEGMYALWYTSPVSIGAGNYAFRGTTQWSSFFHEMGHDVSLNSPSNYFYGGKIDGNANAIFSESMAQIFQHATAYELINNAETYGLNDDIVYEITQSARSAIWSTREGYSNYVNSEMNFASWNDPDTPTDETYNTFMTIAYNFLVHAENSGSGYRVPLKRMMTLLQTFGEIDRERYSQDSNTPAAETFRATLMVAALSYAFGEDLRTEFRDLKFPISDETYNELVSRVSTTALKIPTTISCSVSPSEATGGDFIIVSGSISSMVSGANVTLTYRKPSGTTFTRTVTTDIGYYRDDYKPDSAGSWSVNASWEGDSTYTGVTSASLSFTVSEIPSTISCSVSPSSPTIGDSVTFSGSITPTRSGVTVTIRYKIDGSWNTLTMVTSGSDGSFSYSWNPASVGSCQLMASWEGDDLHSGAASSTVSITVAKMSTTISCSVSPSEIAEESTVTVSGHISAAASGKTVTLTYKKPDGSTFSRTATTDSSGSYSDSYKPNVVGLWSVDASWEGDSMHGGARSQATSFSVEQKSGGIPGFSYELIILGLVLATIILWMFKQRS